MRSTLLRHPLLFLAIFCLLSSAVLLAAPLLNRTYRLTGTLELHPSPTALAVLPESTHLPQTILQSHADPAITHTLTTAANGITLRLETSAPNYDTAYVRLQTFVEQFTTHLKHQSEELASSRATALVKHANRLDNDADSIPAAAQLPSAQSDQAAYSAQLTQLQKLADSTTPFFDITPISLASDSALPSFPSLSMVLFLAPLLGLAATFLLAAWLHKSDHSLHSRAHAAALGLPILGLISEIRTPAQSRNLKRWRTFVRPTLGLALLFVCAYSAIACYRHLSDPAFNAQLHPLTNSLSLGTASGVDAP